MSQERNNIITILKLFVGLHAVHKDGLSGEIVHLGKRPGELLVKFEDRICTSQLINKLKVRGILLSELLCSENSSSLPDINAAKNLYETHFRDIIPEVIFYNFIQTRDNIIKEKNNIIRESALKKIKQNLKSFNFFKAEEIYKYSSNVISSSEYKEIFKIYKKEAEKIIQEYLDLWEISEAESLYKRTEQFLPDYLFDVLQNTKDNYTRNQELRQHARDIDRYLENFDFNSAQNLYDTFFYDHVSRNKFNALVHRFKVIEARLNLQRHFNKKDFLSAENYYQKNKNMLSYEEYKKLLDKTKDNLIKSISSKLNKSKFKEAEELYNKTKHFIPDFSFHKLVCEKKLRKARKALQKIFSEKPQEIEQALRKSFSIDYIPREFTDKDYKLLCTWGNVKKSYSTFDFQSACQSLENHEAARLWSARAAELAAASYYQELGHEVRDTSIEQLDPQSTEWITHDLEIDEIALDVKNSRRSFSNPDNYSEHCVARFKTTHRHGDVRIVGVLSDYLTSDDILSGEQGKCKILGEVSYQEINQLKIWVEKTYGDIFQITHFNPSKELLPGWLFEYPKEHLPDRYTAEFLIPKLANNWLGIEMPRKSFPKYLFNFVDDIEIVRKFGIEENELTIWSQLQSLRQDIGFSLRGVVSFIIGFFLSNIHTDSSVFDKFKIEKWLFPEAAVVDNHHLFPLGLNDSLGYVWNFLQTLQEMMSRAREHLIKFQSFRLRGPNILQGQDKNGRWFTILAYCGGWVRIPVKAKCGRNPIYLGKSESCFTCSKLICPSCGFCSERCHEREPRQQQFAEIKYREINRFTIPNLS